MDLTPSCPASPSPGTPLQSATPDRMNHQREPSALLSSLQHAGAPSPTRGAHSRDSSVHDKINQFNTLAGQPKHLERKAADAALKRAMLGREEAEAEMRRYREEARALRKQVEEGRERERRVSERLETIVENYGRAKETHAHTQALWEKEIRRARKETFKSQSVIVTLQEELKAARAAVKTTEERLTQESERREAREQEAFTAQYNIVGIQEQLDKALERIRVVEQERDAFKTLAKSEEDLARIAAEGRLPLPKSQAPNGEDEDDEFASPKKKRQRLSSPTSPTSHRSSFTHVAEVEELSLLLQWEKQRAERAEGHVEYLKAECQLRACPCMKSRPRNSLIGPRPPTMMSPPKRNRIENLKNRSGPRRSTVFIAEEGVFRTVSQEEAEAMAAPSIPATATETVEDASSDPPITPITPVNLQRSPEAFARTPSLDPPAFAMLAQPRASLLSLLDAPHQIEPPMMFNIPTISTTPGVAVQAMEVVQEVVTEVETRASTVTEEEDFEQTLVPSTRTHSPVEVAHVAPVESEQRQPSPPVAVLQPREGSFRPYTSASHYPTTTTTTTTKVPLREENTDPSLAKRLMALQRTPSNGKKRGRGSDEMDGPSFDVNNPALTPTMTREQALAQIRERRGRARSAMAGAVTPGRSQAVPERREVSAPVGRSAAMSASRKRTRP